MSQPKWIRVVSRAVLLAVGIVVLAWSYFPIQNLLGRNRDGSPVDFAMTAASCVVLGTALILLATRRTKTRDNEPSS